MFYKLDSTKVTLREYAYSTLNPLVLLVALVLKLLRVRLPSSVDDLNVDALTPFLCSADDLPDAARSLFDPALAELVTTGFAQPVFFLVDDSYHQTRTYIACCRQASGQTFARLQLRRWRHPQPPKDTYSSSLVSQRGKAFVITTSAKLDMASPRPFKVIRRVAAPLIDLLNIHQARLHNPGPPIVPIATDAHMLTVIDRQQTVLSRFHRSRGVFKPFTDTELAAQTAERVVDSNVDGVATPQPAPTSEHNAEVLAEIRKLRTNNPGWGKAVVMLVVSIALFVGLGSWQWNWRLTIMLVPILFFHELGHLLAMRIFKYRNLRMFFIPLFGAAVVGRADDVAGWKKVVVSLAGPMPGIIVGGILMWLSQHTLVRETALMMLVLNALNLFPILPLDGGWVVHVLLFSRHRFADIGFRLLAAASLLAASYYFDDRILLFIAIPTLISMPTAYRTARIADELRALGISTAVTPGDVVPVEAACLASDKLRAAIPKGLNTKTLARLTEQVLEAVGARPPGWIATLALGALHVACIGLAFAAIAGGFYMQIQGATPTSR